VDAVRNVGIRDGKIVRVSSEALSGRRVVHAGGLVVAPGFIDLHQHGQDLASQRVKALDGVDELHNSSTTHWVVIFNNTQEVIDKVIPHHLVMISAMASKAIPVTPEPIRARWRNTSAKRERSR